MNEVLAHIYTIFLISVLVISSVSIGYIANKPIGSFIRDIRNRDVDSPGECMNLSMEDTAYCLNNYVRGIYSYKARPDIENPTLEELKEEGGDCKNWAELYVGHIDNLGFYSEMPLIDTSDMKRHTFAIISDDTGYCILDQTSVECFGLGGSEDE